jgi:hypothetical protein
LVVNAPLIKDTCLKFIHDFITLRYSRTVCLGKIEKIDAKALTSKYSQHEKIFKNNWL